MDANLTNGEIEVEELWWDFTSSSCDDEPDRIEVYRKTIQEIDAVHTDFQIVHKPMS